METERIRAVCAIVETGLLREAAQMLHLSPGALSKAVQQIETELNVRLFSREGRGMVLTEQGRLFYQMGKRLLEDVDRMRGVLHEQPPTNRALRLGSFEIFTTYFLARFTEKYAPALPLTVHELGPGRIEEALLAREIDVGITYAPYPNEKLEFIKTASFKNAIFGRSADFRATDFDDLPFAIPITSVQSMASPLRSLDGWPDDRFVRKIKYRFELLETAIQFARRALCVLYCPAFIIKFHNRHARAEDRLSALPEPSGFRARPQPVYLVYRRGERESNEVRLLAKALRNELGPA